VVSMIKTTLKFIWFIFNIFFVLYLISPTPVIKNLPNSVKSTLPGDTTQLKNVSGYFTNLSRTEVMNFYQSFYTGPFLIRLNHPPEKSKTIFRDTMQSYYLEELVLPFKESLFINGFEWEKDVFTKPEKRIVNKLTYNGISYSAKITIRIFPTPIINRLLTFFFVETSIILIFYIYRRLLQKHEK
jgi:hypothetical protein